MAEPSMRNGRLAAGDASRTPAAAQSEGARGRDIHERHVPKHQGDEDSACDDSRAPGGQGGVVRTRLPFRARTAESSCRIGVRRTPAPPHQSSTDALR
jgi:hypothetical protein